MRIIVIANIFTLIGQLCALYASTRKDKNQILIGQSLFMAIVSISSYLLKGYSAIITNMMGIIRNGLVITGHNSKTINYILIAISFVLGYFFNSNGLLGWLPIVANFVVTIVVLNENSKTVHVQLVSCFSSFCWAIFNVIICSYVGAIFNATNGFIYLYNVIIGKRNKTTSNDK